MYELALLQRDGTEQIVPVSGEVIVMGRAPDCDIVINDFNGFLTSLRRLP